MRQAGRTTATEGGRGATGVCSVGSVAAAASAARDLCTEVRVQGTCRAGA